MNYKCGITPENIQELKGNEIFVFGSNMAGKHGAGAALLAYQKFGAKYGIGIGFTGSCYALPTKDHKIISLSIIGENINIKQCVDALLENVKIFKDKYFLITAVGCGLAGYTPKEIAPLFSEFLNLENCSLPQSFIDILTKPKVIRTYKMTDENMQCKGFQYKLGKRYDFEGEIEICEKGFHSCQNPQNCLEFYKNDGKNRLFLCEVEIKDNFSKENSFESSEETLESFIKICSDNITFLEEIPKEKFSILFNSGNWNSGDRNSGDRNSGDRNSGNWNSGNWNSGDLNSGDLNSGNRNSGNGNSGDRNSGNGNSGDRNSGNRNSGNWNSGNRNSGNWNSGNRNSGNWNSGNRNSGNWNSGNWNSGNWNSGNWNSGNWNSGDLNSADAPWRCFNVFQTTKKSDYYFPNWLYFDLVTWKYESEMSEQEKIDYPYYKTCGGCLIVKDYKQAAQESYNKATKAEQDAIEKLPSYDAQVLYDIFGIDRRR